MFPLLEEEALAMGPCRRLAVPVVVVRVVMVEVVVGGRGGGLGQWTM